MNEIIKDAIQQKETILTKCKTQELNEVEDDLKRVINIFDNLIYNETTTDLLSDLYLHRAILNEVISVKNYFLDIIRSSLLQGKEATVIKNSKKFAKLKEKFKIIFLFDLLDVNNGLEFSSLFIISGEVNDLWTEKLRISTNISSSENLINDFNNINDNLGFKKILARLAHSIMICDEFFSTDLINAKKIMEKQLGHKTFDSIFSMQKGASIKNLIQNGDFNKIIDDPYIETVQDLYNNIFNTNIDCYKSEFNLILLAELISLKQYYKKAPYYEVDVLNFKKKINDGKCTFNNL